MEKFFHSSSEINLSFELVGMASEGVVTFRRLEQGCYTPGEGTSTGRTKSLMDLLFGTTLAKPAGRPAVIAEWHQDDSKQLSHKKACLGLRSSARSHSSIDSIIRDDNSKTSLEILGSVLLNYLHCEWQLRVMSSSRGKKHPKSLAEKKNIAIIT